MNEFHYIKIANFHLSPSLIFSFFIERREDALGFLKPNEDTDFDMFWPFDSIRYVGKDKYKYRRVVPHGYSTIKLFNNRRDSIDSLMSKALGDLYRYYCERKSFDFREEVYKRYTGQLIISKEDSKILGEDADLFLFYLENDCYNLVEYIKILPERIQNIASEKFSQEVTRFLVIELHLKNLFTPTLVTIGNDQSKYKINTAQGQINQFDLYLQSLDDKPDVNISDDFINIIPTVILKKDPQTKDVLVSYQTTFGPNTSLPLTGKKIEAGDFCNVNISDLFRYSDNFIFNYTKKSWACGIHDIISRAYPLTDVLESVEAMEDYCVTIERQGKFGEYLLSYHNNQEYGYIRLKQKQKDGSIRRMILKAKYELLERFVNEFNTSDKKTAFKLITNEFFDDQIPEEFANKFFHKKMSRNEAMKAYVVGFLWDGKIKKNIIGFNEFVPNVGKHQDLIINSPNRYCFVNSKNSLWSKIDHIHCTYHYWINYFVQCVIDSEDAIHESVYDLNLRVKIPSWEISRLQQFFLEETLYKEREKEYLEEMRLEHTDEDTFYDYKSIARDGLDDFYDVDPDWHWNID